MGAGRDVRATLRSGLNPDRFLEICALGSYRGTSHKMFDFVGRMCLKSAAKGI